MFQNVNQTSCRSLSLICYVVFDCKLQAGRTALTLAAEKGHPETLQLLLEKGSNTEIKAATVRVAVISF